VAERPHLFEDLRPLGVVDHADGDDGVFGVVAQALDQVSERLLALGAFGDLVVDQDDVGLVGLDLVLELRQVGGAPDQDDAAALAGGEGVVQRSFVAPGGECGDQADFLVAHGCGVAAAASSGGGLGWAACRVAT